MKREKVKELVKKGFSVQEISATLSMNKLTVKYYIEKLFKEYGVKTRYQLIVKLFNVN